MQNQKMKKLAAFYAIGLVIIMSIAVSVFAQDKAVEALPEVSVDRTAGDTTLDTAKTDIQRVVLNLGATGKVEVTINNPTDRLGDADFIGIDALGNEAARQTIELSPGMNATVQLADIFKSDEAGSLAFIKVQVSVRPTFDLDLSARMNPIAFFSQQSSQWGSNKLGTCRYDTIKSAGCAITAISMAGSSRATGLNPATMNTYLTNNGGYSSGCLVNWSKAADFDGTAGFKYVGSGTVKSASSLKSNIDAGNYLVTRSSRFTNHYVVIVGYDNQGTAIGDFFYYDPWDLNATKRKVGDGWVSTSSATQIYR